MTTTAQTMTAAPTARRWKWSGETEEPDYSRWNYDDDERTTSYKEYQKKLRDDAWNDYAHAHDDDDDDDDNEDTGTLTVEEQRRIQWYHATAHAKSNGKSESNNSNFGLCCHCKKKLNDRADFVCNPQESFYRMCIKCHEDYSKPKQPNQ